MHISHETTGDLTATIRIELHPEDYQDSVQKKLKEYRQKASMPGFRPGMVPMGLVNKMYGRSVLAEEVTRILNDNLTEYINQQGMKTLGSPLANEEKSPRPDWDAPSGFEFYFDIGLSPEFEPELKPEIEVEYLKISISDEQLDKEVETLRRSYGSFEAVETAEEGDWLTVSMSELGADGEILDGGVSHSRRVTNDTFDQEDMKKSLLGLKAGDSLTFSPSSVISDPVRLGYLLNIEKEKAAEIGGDFKMEVTAVERLKLADLNQELYSKIFPSSGFETYEDFRQALKTDMEKSFEREGESHFFAAVRKEMLTTYNPPLPEEFLKRWMKDRQEEEHEHEHEHDHHHDHDHDHEHHHPEPDYKQVFESMRWQLIENRLIEKYGIRVGMDDVKNYVKERYRMYFGQQGALPQDEEKVEETLNLLAEKYVQKKEDVEQVYDMLYNDRLISLFRENLQIKVKEVSHEEFHELTGTHHH